MEVQNEILAALILTLAVAIIAVNSFIIATTVNFLGNLFYMLAGDKSYLSPGF